MPTPFRGRPSRSTIYARLVAAAEDLRRYGGLPNPTEARPIWSDIWHLEATTPRRSRGTRWSTARSRSCSIRVGPSAPRSEGHLEVKGYASAAEWVYRQARDRGTWTADDIVTMTEIREIHSEAMTPVWEVAPIPTQHRRRHQATFGDTT